MKENYTVGTDKTRDELTAVISRMAVKLLKTPGLTPQVAAIVHDLLYEWSYASLLKKVLAYPVKKVLPREDSVGLQPRTSMAADIAKLLTLLAVSSNEERSQNPDGNGKVRGKAAQDFLANANFGHFLKVVELSEGGLKPAMDAFNAVFWQYPTKFGSAAAMLSPLFRMGVKFLYEFLAPIEEKIGPDILGDVVMTILRDSDSESIAKLTNCINELVRRIHTGSLLLGKGDKSKLDTYLDDLMQAYHGAKDRYLEKMMPVYWGEIRESIANASARSLKDNPDLFLAQVASLGAVKSSELKVKNARLQLFEAAEKDKLGEVMSESAKEFDTYEAAGLINATCRVLNQLHDTQPELMASLMTSVVDSVSPDEVSRVSEWLVPEAVTALKPLASAIMPELLKGLTELIRGDGYVDEKYSEAIREFRDALSDMGGAQ